MIVMNFNGIDVILMVNLVKFIIVVIILFYDDSGCRKIPMVNLVMNSEIYDGKEVNLVIWQH